MNAEHADARILLVDDTPDNLDLLTKILERAGHRVIEKLEDSREFEATLARFAPDIILLDLMMPHVNGFELLPVVRRAREDGTYLPVIVVTADVSKDSRDLALRSGANDFLTKPFDNDEVVLRVGNLLGTRMLHRRLSELNRRLDDHNRELDERVRERTRELEGARLEILERLARAAEFRDDDTGKHTQRVGELAGRLASRIGFGAEESRELALAAPLHDIGKIGIPDGVLLKPGRLDAGEIEIMKSHTVIGARILGGSGVPVLQRAEELALTHHERWDGQGYPNGIAGEEIPISGRILAIVDVFDALTHERPYRQAWPVSQVVEYIREGSGAHFDPALVEAFVPLVENGS